ncbi:MBL fold metallo-hydrolase RNA specificity domain-containing protein [Kaarinaea lacus]
MKLTFYGAAEEVTGSCHLLTVAGRSILIDCGLIQGSPKDEARNRHRFPFTPQNIDAVILSHSHIDHSGRIPLLVKWGFKGPIYTQHASRDLCRIMLKDSGYLNEKNTEWENKKRRRKGLAEVEALYTMQDAQVAMQQIKGCPYNEWKTIFPGIQVCFHDAGHILGSAIVELKLKQDEQLRSIVFSGDLGKYGAPILRDPVQLKHADFVVMESTYGDRNHRAFNATLTELKQVIAEAYESRGNILIPSFAVGRSQELLYLFGKYYHDWELKNWQIFLDSPMAIEATQVYSKHANLYDQEAAQLWHSHLEQSLLPNLAFTRTANQSMKLNIFRSGAIIIAGSGMCTGGRIRHHLKHNVWRKNCHIVIVGFQAMGTLGRQLVDGARFIRLWGEAIRVAATVHTIGGLSAHADQSDLLSWYNNFNSRPPLYLVHGELGAITALQQKLANDYQRSAVIPKFGETVDLLSLPSLSR